MKKKDVFPGHPDFGNFEKGKYIFFVGIKIFFLTKIKEINFLFYFL